MYKTSRINLRFWILSSVGAMAIGGIGGGAFVLYKQLTAKESDKVKLKYEYSEIRSNIYNDNEWSNAPKLIEVNAFPKGSGSDPSRINDYWLGKKGRELLIHRIRTELQKGPEFTLLKDIIIGDENKIQEESNGVYIPASNEIVINTHHFRHFFPTINSTDEKAVDINLKYKVEQVMEVLTHEYGHHIAYTYLNSSRFGNSNTTPVSGEGALYHDSIHGRKVGEWNKSFIRDFKHLLHYDDETSPLYTSSNINRTEPFYKSIGSYFRAKDIFDLANGAEKPEYGLIDKGLRFGAWGREFTKNSRAKSDDKIGYMYSLDEIYTRKYLQLTYVFNRNGMFNIADKNTSRIDKEGWIHEKGDTKIKYATDFLLDTLNYKNQLDSTGAPHEFYLNDAPYLTESESSKRNKNVIPRAQFVQPAEGLYNLMRRHFGQDSGDDVSFVWSMNSAKLIDADHIKINNVENYDQIKFGGYITDEEANGIIDPLTDKVTTLGYNFIGYKKSDGSWEAMPIQIHDFTYAKKDALESITPSSIEGTEKKFYSLTNYVSAKSIKNKKLYFLRTKTETNPVPLASVRTGVNGYASNWLNHYPGVNLGTVDEWRAEVSDVDGSVSIRNVSGGSNA